MSSATTTHAVPPSLLEIGIIGRPHGVAGEVRLTLHNRDSDAIYGVDTVFVRSTEDDAPQQMTVQMARQGGKWIILRLKGIDDRLAASTLTGAALFVARSALPALEEGQFYVADLVGVSVFVGDRCIGRVSHSQVHGGVEILFVVDDNTELQIPMVEQYVTAVDVPGQRIEVANIDGLPVFAF